MNSDLLDQISIALPCQESWDAMPGDERQRFCTRCQQQVYNISEMNREDAMALVNSTGRICVRIYRRPDGTVVTRDCREMLRAARRQFAAGVALVATLVVALLVSAGFAGARRFSLKRGEHLRGDVAGMLLPLPKSPPMMGKPSQYPPPPVKAP